MNQAMSEKILVLGIDGMDPRYTRHLLEKGKMPNTRTLIERGACRADLVMLGSHPTITPPMWTTLSTGAHPVTHGITCYNRQSERGLDWVEYNFDSRHCKAEQLWNVFAEAGKKTLVFHWPGCSWPPTSDSDHLYVIDGTNPPGVNNLAAVDGEFLFVASEQTEYPIFKERAASDSNIPCVINDLSTSDLQLDTSSALGQQKKVMLSAEEGEGVVSVLPVDVVLSPVKKAEGWLQAPTEAKEFTMLLSHGLLRRVGLILPNEQGKYDRVALYKNKKSTEPIVVLETDVFTPYVFDEALVEDDELRAVFRNMRILELTEEGTYLKMWVSKAMDLYNDDLWSPKRLYREITEQVGYPHPFSFMGGSDKKLIQDCTGANWWATGKWQADCINYLIAHEGVEIVFSHYHSVDLQGHMIVKYLKEKNLPGQKLTEAEYLELFDFVYAQADDYIGEFLHLLDEGWTILLVSDHGQVCPEHEHHLLGDPNGVNVRVMQELGYTVLKYDENGQELHEIDWTKTKAVATRANMIYLNLVGRNNGQGIVPVEEQYELEEEIMTALYGYRDKTTGKRIIACALRNKDAILLGLGGSECGDIIYWTAEGYNMDHGDSLATTWGYAQTSVSPIFIAAGTGIKAGYTTERIIREVDVAPTVAALGGVRMPDQCEGAPVYQIFTERY